jgi:hypothetical protein
MRSATRWSEASLATRLSLTETATVRPVSERRWYPVVNDLVGGWAVASEDLPMSQMPGALGHFIFCDTSTEWQAELLADLLNEHFEREDSDGWERFDQIFGR